MTARPNAEVKAGSVTFSNRAPLVLIAGPCQMEVAPARLRRWPDALKEMAERLGIGLVYKTSFDKANRTSAAGQRGLGLDKALADLRRRPRELGMPRR